MCKTGTCKFYMSESGRNNPETIEISTLIRYQHMIWTRLTRPGHETRAQTSQILNSNYAIIQLCNIPIMLYFHVN